VVDHEAGPAAAQRPHRLARSGQTREGINSSLPPLSITPCNGFNMHNLATTPLLNASENAVSVEPAKRWIWPLPRLDGINPAIIPTHEQARTDGLVQIGYPDRTSSPEFVPVFAPQDGIIKYAVRAKHGTTLCLDHPAGWSTQYSEFVHVLALAADRSRRRRNVRVRAGDVLGHVRSSLRIRFGLSRLVNGDWVVIDPAEVVHTWSLQPWFGEATSRVGSTITG
jgi:murein DD-endopeptidase MepM/ murein hydrolase activator NlpD